jgi:DNA gyrase inhibitor GyrI
MAEVTLIRSTDNRVVMVTVADDAGGYQFTKVPAGQYVVQFRFPGTALTGYAPGVAAFIDATRYTVLDRTITVVDVTAPATGIITGRVVDRGGNAPPTTTVQPVDAAGFGYGATSDTDATGRYRMLAFAGTGIGIRFTRPTGYVQWAHLQSSEAAATRFRLLPNDTLTVDETLLEGSQITTFLTNPDGTWVEGGHVELVGPVVRTGTTDAWGAVRFVDLVPGSYTVQFSSPDSTRTQFAYGAVDPAHAAVVTVEAGASVSVTDSLLPTGSVAVTVTDQSGAAVPGACGYLFGGVNARSGCSGIDGVVVIDGAPQFDGYQLTITTDGRYRSVSIDRVTVTGGQVTAITVRLTPAG